MRLAQRGDMHEANGVTPHVTCALALALASCGGAPSAPPSAAVETRSQSSAETRSLEQRALDEEIERAAADPDVETVVAVVLDPRDGRLLAMSAMRGGSRQPELPARETFGHGSVVKTFTIAAALDAGLIAPTDSFDGSGGTYALAGTTVRDASRHGAMSVADVLAFSSNVGTTRIYERLGRAGLLRALAAFRLDHRVGESAREDDAEAATVAYGAGLEATPLEIAAAFAVIANGGVHHRPWRAGEAPSAGERVIRAETAEAMLALLEGVVARDDGTGRRARVPGHRVAGKTGTTPRGEGMFGAFVGTLPIEAPRFVILVGVETRSDGYSGGTVAAPLFGRIAARLVEHEDQEHQDPAGQLD